MEAVAAPADRPARFDRVARVYRAMEYFSFGPLLERCRSAQLPALGSVRRALVIGDGDGRFTARLLANNASVQIDAVDASPAMLRLLEGRAARQAACSRVRTCCADARIFTPHCADYDLVVTHFFLDCLSSAETADLAHRIRPRLAPGARWLISEFEVPKGNRLRAGFARVLIQALYAAFRLLTGLTPCEIPRWREALALAGFAPGAQTRFLGGVLVSELWEFHNATAREALPSHEQSHGPQRRDESATHSGHRPRPCPHAGAAAGA